MNSRRTLEQRREHFSFEFAFDGLHYTAGAGFFYDGDLAELFLTCNKPGSAAGTAARDGAIAVSIALQHGASLETLRHALTRLSDGRAAGPVGHALDRIAANEQSTKLRK